jgi:hypothetical protein
MLVGAASLGVRERDTAGYFEQSFSSSQFSQNWKICFGQCEAALSRRGAECQRHLPEGGEERERRGQMHDHTANRNQHTCAQFQQTFTECPDLSSGTAGVRGSQTQLLHQYVRGSGEQDAELVGPEVAAAGAVDLEIVQFSR